MIKLIYCIRRREDLTHEEFSRYWREVHAPIAARIPGLLKLVQNHARRIPGDRREPDFDGVAELWFESPRSLLEARNSPAWMASGEDEANFIAPTGFAYLVVEEHEIEPDPDPGDILTGDSP